MVTASISIPSTFPSVNCKVTCTSFSLLKYDLSQIPDNLRIHKSETSITESLFFFNSCNTEIPSHFLYPFTPYFTEACFFSLHLWVVSLTKICPWAFVFFNLYSLRDLISGLNYHFYKNDYNFSNFLIHICKFLLFINKLIVLWETSKLFSKFILFPIIFKLNFFNEIPHYILSH